MMFGTSKRKGLHVACFNKNTLQCTKVCDCFDRRRNQYFRRDECMSWILLHTSFLHQYIQFSVLSEILLCIVL